MNTNRLLATLEAYPDQPKAPTLNEVRHALHKADVGVWSSHVYGREAPSRVCR
jgi:hypothetical protein